MKGRVGDKVVCTGFADFYDVEGPDHNAKFLTIGKTYTIMNTQGNSGGIFFIIIADNGEEFGANWKFFKCISECRLEKLKLLGI